MKKVGIGTACILALQLGPADAGPLTGDMIDVAMIRTVDTGYGLGRITGYGLDGPFVVVDGIADRKQYSSTFTIDVDGAGFLLDFLDTAGWQDGIVLRLADLDFSPTSGVDPSDLTVQTNLIGLSFVSGSNYIDIALGNTRFSPATYIAGSFGSHRVPEPSTFALAVLALGAIAALGIAPRKARTESDA